MRNKNHEKKCLFCKETFQTANKKQKYCSITCMAKNFSIVRRTVPPRNCLECKKQFQPRAVRDGDSYKGKFCSIKCSSNHRYKETEKYFYFKCSLCRKDFKRLKRTYTPSRSKTGLRFCSTKCLSLGTRPENGLIPAKENFWKSYKKIAFRNLPHKCNRCNYDEEIKILQVHHIDRNKKNWSLDNLEILCPRCHAIEHFTAKDGHFRTGRRNLAEKQAPKI